MWGRLSSLPVEATFQSPRPSGIDACPSLGRGLESPLCWQARSLPPHARPQFFHSFRRGDQGGLGPDRLPQKRAKLSQSFDSLGKGINVIFFKGWCFENRARGRGIVLKGLI